MDNKFFSQVWKSLKDGILRETTGVFIVKEGHSLYWPNIFRFFAGRKRVFKELVNA